MIRKAPSPDAFKERWRESLQRAALDFRTVKIAKRDNVYTCGDQDKTIYFIESGQIKLIMLSPDGKECLLAIHSAGDIFGELSLSESGPRMETATAMKDTILKQMPCSQFLARLNRDSLFEDFVRCLTARVIEQQQTIADLIMDDSEHLLGKTLLQLGRALGKKDPHGLRIETRRTHEELSEMVGTTRPRISMFMERFRKHGLLETNREHSLFVKEERLTGYLTQIAQR
jgi:CRP/FNR family cyclic AMP-dependent transcriptional regulator